MKATSADVPRLSAAAGDAMASDPIIRWSLQMEDPGERSREYFRLLNEGYAEQGMLWQKDGVGVASWVPPGKTEVFVEMDARTRPWIATVAPDGGKRAGEFWDWIAENLPDESHWYLDYLAVDPARQGEGLGTALLEFGLALARRDGAPAFLETSREQNVGYYERFGFGVTEELDAPGGGPHIWFMLRA